MCTSADVKYEAVHWLLKKNCKAEKDKGKVYFPVERDNTGCNESMDCTPNWSMTHVDEY